VSQPPQHMQQTCVWSRRMYYSFLPTLKLVTGPRRERGGGLGGHSPSAYVTDLCLVQEDVLFISSNVRTCNGTEEGEGGGVWGGTAPPAYATDLCLVQEDVLFIYSNVRTCNGTEEGEGRGLGCHSPPNICNRLVSGPGGCTIHFFQR
jgi:hypothetical protein